LRPFDFVNACRTFGGRTERADDLREQLQAAIEASGAVTDLQTGDTVRVWGRTVADGVLDQLAAA
jgi:hypothetical protein